MATVASLLVRLGLDSKRFDKGVKRAARGLDNLIKRFDRVGDIGKMTAIATAVSALTSLTAAAGPAAGAVLALPAAALVAGTGVSTLAASLSGMGDALTATATVTTHLNVLAERLGALIAAQQTHATRPVRVLFVCGHNSGRSQIADALLTHRATEPITVSSAGTDPASELEPHLAEILAEVGVDLGRAYPKPLTEEVVEAADFVITLGCGDACPVVPGRRYLDWPTPDPHGASPSELRRIRDVIDTHVSDLLSLIAAPTSVPTTVDPK
ncbi:arsenate-mycothiol transferase ArsC [Nocardiopsis listeri]|uniref:arsenate-mycothiol transferase ArsC n=1 Tax=Nocardiopsis listeri TaxID=53440 RepID=UPI000AA9AA5F|nr:arsenate reductase ArsC [Nocardiopsis listeri]